MTSRHFESGSEQRRRLKSRLPIHDMWWDHVTLNMQSPAKNSCVPFVESWCEIANFTSVGIRFARANLVVRRTFHINSGWPDSSLIYFRRETRTKHSI